MTASLIVSVACVCVCVWQCLHVLTAAVRTLSLSACSQVTTLALSVCLSVCQPADAAATMAYVKLTTHAP